ncbi:3,4-dihydroxy-2-butanone-4-phosphate synthase [Rhodococcus pyridinivorans]|uniref:3,4-dihydroxy-2-butanone-4-phosphate synthase n=1 Tax=Rhodococcus pyridinivorans TaxID=103816 RepID=UPI003556B401
MRRLSTLPTTSVWAGRSKRKPNPNPLTPENWNPAVKVLESGNPVLVATDTGTALVYGAATITTTQMADLIRCSSGFVQVALPSARCDTLLIPEAAPTVRDERRPGFGQCVTVDATNGVTTGISAADRAHTARVLCSPASTAADLTRPGHMVPVRADIAIDPSGCSLPLAAVALALTEMAFPVPGAVYAELVSELDPSHPISLNEARQIAERRHTLLVCA